MRNHTPCAEQRSRSYRITRNLFQIIQMTHAIFKGIVVPSYRSETGSAVFKKRRKRLAGKGWNAESMCYGQSVRFAVNHWRGVSQRRGKFAKVMVS
jgi:hypothetical protein